MLWKIFGSNVKNMIYRDIQLCKKMVCLQCVLRAGISVFLCAHLWAVLREILHPSPSSSLSWGSVCKSSVMKTKVPLFPTENGNQNLPLVFPAQTCIHQSSILTLAEAQKQLFSFWSRSICIGGTCLRTKGEECW